MGIISDYLGGPGIITSILHKEAESDMTAEKKGSAARKQSRVMQPEAKEVSNL